jgi:hypothetical protein
MYAAVDPIYMLQLLKILGDDYIVWDKAAHIRFLKPGKSTLHARFLIEDRLVEEIKRRLETDYAYTFDIPVELVDRHGTPNARITKTLYVRLKAPKVAHPKAPQAALQTESVG